MVKFKYSPNLNGGCQISTVPTHLTKQCKWMSHKASTKFGSLSQTLVACSLGCCYWYCRITAYFKKSSLFNFSLYFLALGREYKHVKIRVLLLTIRRSRFQCEIIVSISPFFLVSSSRTEKENKKYLMRNMRQTYSVNFEKWKLTNENMENKVLVH